MSFSSLSVLKYVNSGVTIPYKAIRDAQDIIKTAMGHSPGEEYQESGSYFSILQKEHPPIIPVRLTAQGNTLHGFRTFNWVPVWLDPTLGWVDIGEEVQSSDIPAIDYNGKGQVGFIVPLVKGCGAFGYFLIASSSDGTNNSIEGLSCIIAPTIVDDATRSRVGRVEVKSTGVSIAGGKQLGSPYILAVYGSPGCNSSLFPKDYGFLSESAFVRVL